MAEVKAHHESPPAQKKKHPDADGDDSSDEKTRRAPLPTDKERVELEATDNEALSLLALACFRENYDDAKACLDNDDNNDKLVLTDPVDADRRTVLHYCVQNRSTRLAALVIERDERVINAAEANGHTPLQLSVIAGNLPMAEHLLKSGANINRSDNNSHSVAHWAVASQYKDIQTFRHFIDLFDKYDADLNSHDSEKATPLHYAAQSMTENEKQKDDMIEYLVAKKVDVDSRDIYDRTPLIWAATTGSDVGCKSLLKAEADANARDTDGITALHCAASWGHVKCIEILTKEGAIVDSPDINGCTPLFYSVIHRQPESTKLLIRRKANTNHQDHKGRSVTHCAAAIGSTDCLEILRSNKTDMWLQSKKKGHYPIHEAAIQSHTGCVKFLLEKCSKDRKRDMNLGNVNGRTCLHIAAMTGNFPLVEYLVKTGAETNVIMTSRDRQLTPYDSALAKRQLQCADYLLRHGAKSAKQLRKEKEEEEEEEKRKKQEETEKEKEEEKEEGREGDGEENTTVAGSTLVVIPAVVVAPKVKKVKKVVVEVGAQTEDGAFDDWYDGANGKPKGKKKVVKVKTGNASEDEDKKKKKNRKEDDDDEEEEEKENKKRLKKTKKQKPDDDNDDGDEPKKRRPRRKDEQTEAERQQALKAAAIAQRQGPRPGLSPQRQVTKKLYKPYFSLIQEQVRVFELKRLASLKMQKSLKFERQGNEKATVRRLARDFNEEARPEDRVAAGQFSRIKDFQKHLKGEYKEAEDWEKRLKKIEKVSPLYDSRHQYREDWDDDTRIQRTSHTPPPVAKKQKQQHQDGRKGRATNKDSERRRRRRSTDDDDDNDSDYDSSDNDNNRSNNNGNHGDGESDEEGKMTRRSRRRSKSKGDEK